MSPALQADSLTSEPWRKSSARDGDGAGDTQLSGPPSRGAGRSGSCPRCCRVVWLTSDETAAPGCSKDASVRMRTRAGAAFWNEAAAGNEQLLTTVMRREELSKLFTRSRNSLLEKFAVTRRRRWSVFKDRPTARYQRGAGNASPWQAVQQGLNTGCPL